MKKKSAIIKLSLIGAAIVIGFVLAFCPMQFGTMKYKSFAGAIKLGLDLKGGVYAVYSAELAEGEDDFDSAMDGTIASIQSTLISKGYTEATLQRQGSNNIRVSVPDVSDPQEILKIIGSPAEIKFVLNGSTVLTGREVVKATGTYSSENGGYVVALSLNAAGAKAFGDATTNNIGSRMDIVTIIAGEERTISSPEIQSGITGGQAVITGMQSLSAAQELAGQITAGKMAMRLTQKEVSTVAATLGENALKYGLIAGAIGILLVIAFIIFFYGLFGVAGAISLLIYTVLMLFFLAAFPWVQLTLPGIAGVLLSIGMAIDGNIIIYERIKDEYRNGKSILSASHYGFRKSIGAILDGNITTILAAIVLWIFGTGAVQGFAITLLIGLVLAVFSSLVVARGLTKYMVNITQDNPRLYRLVRGQGYEQLTADQNSAMAELLIQEEERTKREKKEKKEAAPEGGVI